MIKTETIEGGDVKRGRRCERGCAGWSGGNES